MTEKKTEAAIPAYAEPYCVEDHRLCLTKTVKRQTICIPLCNCTPYITSELTFFDNGETSHLYRIAGFDFQGHPLPEVDVPATELGTLKWMDKAWPAACSKTAAGSVEKQIECAIKSTGAAAEHRNVYAYTGWTKLGGQYYFLLPGNPDYEVILRGKQTGYAMAADCPNAAIEVLFGMLLTDRLPQEVIYPCLALVFLSPLNEFLRRASYEPKFILALVGRTGSMKSTLAALLLSFFGKFTATDLPMSFRDTANSLLYNAAALKDVLACVDDFHPSTRKDSDDMKKSMQMLARAYGDRATRERLTSDIRIRDTPQPRGNLIVTAEFPPDIGESGAARLFTVEMLQSKMDLEMLSYFQRQAHDGVLMQCMCDTQHEAFDISSKALAKQLAADGLIEVSGDGKNTRTYRFGNVSKRVMFLKKEEAEKIMRDEE